MLRKRKTSYRLFIISLFWAGLNLLDASSLEAAPLALAWCDDTPGNYEIFVKTSVDNGATWSAARRLTNNAGDSLYPSVAVSGSNIHVFWQDNAPGNYEIYYKTSADYGVTWSASKRLTSNAGDSSDTSVAVSGSNIHVAWWDNTSGNHEIYFRTSQDSGTSWSATKRLTNNAGISAYPSISSSGANVHVAWFDNTPGNFEIYLISSADNGATWSSPKRLTNNAGSSYEPSLAANGANVYLAWKDRTPGNYEIYFKMSSDNGLTWSAPKRLTNNAGGSHEPSIASVGSDVYVSWFDNSAGDEEIYAKTSADNGATWSAARRLTSTAGFSIYPSTAVSGSRVHVAWSDSSTGNYEIYLKTSADKGVTWSAVKRMTFNSGNSSQASVR